ncbi:hydroxymethylbilane synthase, partial [Desulfovibrio sp. OttesenSCG-928-F20]|nr:hydroxymethylbilane synthase [Desulfovibrio sp. OttesenSCG-928-F20]
HGIEVDLLVLKTKGDIILDVPLSKVGGKGLFVKEIEEALLDGRADLAVHSMKDVPMELPAGLVLGAVPRRESAADLLLSCKFSGLASLPQGARVGTSSLRRQAQLLALRPDLDIVSLRGNVDTRIRKLENGEFDAIVMAAAGMQRLGLSTPHMFALEAPDFLPAAGQGALGVELRSDRQDVMDMLAFLDHPESRVRVEAERGFLAGLEGGCQVPIAAYAVLADQQNPTEQMQSASIQLEGLVADVSGKRIIRASCSGPTSQARQLGLDLAQEIKSLGGAAILRELYGDANHAQS